MYLYFSILYLEDLIKHYLHISEESDSNGLIYKYLNKEKLHSCYFRQKYKFEDTFSAINVSSSWGWVGIFANSCVYQTPMSWKIGSTGNREMQRKMWGIHQ